MLRPEAVPVIARRSTNLVRRDLNAPPALVFGDDDALTALGLVDRLLKKLRSVLRDHVPGAGMGKDCMRVAVLVAAALGAVLVVGAGLAWNEGWLREGVVSDAVVPAQAQAGPTNDLDVTVRFDLAIRRHDAAEVAKLLASGADPDSVDASGETLLNKAVLFGTPEIVGIMLDAGADPDLPGPNGLGPLAIAALAGRHESLERLMEASGAGAGASRPEVSSPVLPSANQPPPSGAARAAPSALPQPSPAARGAPAPAASVSPVPSPPPATDGATGGSATTAARGPALATGRSAVATDPADANVLGGRPGSVPTAWIVAVQRRLGELGFYKGAADGVAGPQTANAITSYQAVAGVPQDGLVSQDLMLRIGAKVDGQPRPPGALPPVSAPSARPLSPADVRGDQPAARPDG